MCKRHTKKRQTRNVSYIFNGGLTGESKDCPWNEYLEIVFRFYKGKEGVDLGRSSDYRIVDVERGILIEPPPRTIARLRTSAVVLVDEDQYDLLNGDASVIASNIRMAMRGRRNQTYGKY